MEHDTVWWAVAAATLVAGSLLAMASTRRLGRVRAAANWPAAPRVGWGGRPLARAGAATGLALLAAGVGVATVRLTRPGDRLGWLVPAAAVVAVAVAGGLVGAKLAERAELAALIRTPPTGERARARADRDADPLVPAGGRPGWVYRDHGGDWYLAVAAEEPGQRLVRLPDFALVPAGSVAAPLDLAGSVQIAVYPVQEPRPTGTGQRERSRG